MTGSLFDNSAPLDQPKRDKPPVWVVRELVDIHGIPQRTVAKWHARQCFAVMHNLRRKKAKTDPDGIEDTRVAVAGTLSDRLHRDEYRPEEMHDALQEALALLDRDELATVARVVIQTLRATRE